MRPLGTSHKRHIGVYRSRYIEARMQRKTTDIFCASVFDVVVCSWFDARARAFVRSLCGLWFIECLFFIIIFARFWFTVSARTPASGRERERAPRAGTTQLLFDNNREWSARWAAWAVHVLFVAIYWHRAKLGLAVRAPADRLACNKTWLLFLFFSVFFSPFLPVVFFVLWTT